MTATDDTTTVLRGRRLSDREPGAVVSRAPRTCARSGCDNPVPRNRRGRPTIYCSPLCRPSARRSSALLVEVGNPDTSPDGRPPERVWTVTLRRGGRAVVIADDLGWPSAHALARQLEELLGGPVPTRGGAVD